MTSETPTPKKSINAVAFWSLVVLCLLLPSIPFVSALIGPLDQFDTMVHEMSHALVCMLTGGHVSGLTIVSDGNGHGGLTFCRGGNSFLYTQAGYLGTAFFGCLLIFLGQFTKASKVVLCAIGASMALATVFLVGANVFATGFQGFFSFAWGLALSAFLIWAGLKWQHRYANLLILFLAAQTALNSISSVFILVRLYMGALPDGAWSDASNMAQMTGIPALVWSLFWVVCSVFMLLLTLKWTYGAALFTHNEPATTVAKQS
jgi:hypothetical protein